MRKSTVSLAISTALQFSAVYHKGPINPYQTAFNRQYLETVWAMESVQCARSIGKTLSHPFRYSGSAC